MPVSFQGTLLIRSFPCRCSTRQHTRKSNPTYQARNADTPYRQRFQPVPRGCGGQRGFVPPAGRLSPRHAACRMGDFVNGGLNRLQLAHTLFDSNSLIGQTEISVCAVCDLLKSNRNGGTLFQRAAKKSSYCSTSASSGLTERSGNSLPSVCEMSKTGYNLKGGNGNFLFFLNRLSLAVKYGLSCVGGRF